MTERACRPLATRIAEPAERTVNLLKQVIRNDPDQSVRLKAVEALSEVKDDRASIELRSIIAASTDPSIQVKATEALGEGAQSEEDVRDLVTLARTHPNSDVRRQAIEALGVGIGSAVFDGAFSPTKGSLRNQILDILEACDRAPAMAD